MSGFGGWVNDGSHFSSKRLTTITSRTWLNISPNVLPSNSAFLSLVLREDNEKASVELMYIHVSSWDQAIGICISLIRLTQR